jgi:hypothetical protein
MILIKWINFPKKWLSVVDSRLFHLCRPQRDLYLEMADVVGPDNFDVEDSARLEHHPFIENHIVCLEQVLDNKTLRLHLTMDILVTIFARDLSLVVHFFRGGFR